MEVMQKAWNRVISYFDRLSQQDTRRFIVETSTLCFGLKIITAVILALVSILPGLEILSTTSVDHTLLFYDPQSGTIIFSLFIIGIMVLAVPLGETLLGQLLPIEVFYWLTGKPYFSLLISMLVFALWHGFPDMFIILPISFVLAWSYWVQRHRSLRRAFLVTSALHAIQNALALSVWYLSLFATEEITGFEMSVL